MGKDIATEHKVDIDQFMMQTPVAHSLAYHDENTHIPRRRHSLRYDENTQLIDLQGNLIQFNLAENSS